MHALVADRHSLGAVQQALRELERLGLTTTETIGRAGVHRINEGHAAIAPLRSLASPLEMLTRVVQEAVTDVAAVIVFGSVARGDAHADSDSDLVVIAPATWAGRAGLQQQVHERLGNGCDVLHLTREHFELAPEDREPVVAEVLRDGIALVGKMPREPGGVMTRVRAEPRPELSPEGEGVSRLGSCRHHAVHHSLLSGRDLEGPS